MYPRNQVPSSEDPGAQPFVFSLARAAERNPFYRKAVWTGRHLQLTLMSIPPHGEIGLEVHPDDDQLLRIESGAGIVKMGSRRERLTFQQPVSRGDAVFVPANTWHNVVNTGGTSLKLSSVYAPPHHPRGTIHRTNTESDLRGD